MVEYKSGFVVLKYPRKLKVGSSGGEGREQGGALFIWKHHGVSWSHIRGAKQRASQSGGAPDMVGAVLQ